MHNNNAAAAALLLLLPLLLPSDAQGSSLFPGGDAAARLHRFNQEAVHQGSSSSGGSRASATSMPRRHLQGVIPAAALKASAAAVKGLLQAADQDVLVKGTPLEGKVASALKPDLPVKAQLFIPQKLAAMAPELLGSLPQGGQIKLSDFAAPNKVAEFTADLDAMVEPLAMAQRLSSFGMQLPSGLLPGLTQLAKQRVSVPQAVKDTAGDAVAIDSLGARLAGAADTRAFDFTNSEPPVASNSQTISAEDDKPAATVSHSDAKGLASGATGTSQGTAQSRLGPAAVLSLGSAKSVKGPVRSYAAGRASSELQDATDLALNKALNTFGSATADTFSGAKAPEGQAKALSGTLAATLLGDARAKSQVLSQSDTGNSFGAGATAALSGLLGDATSDNKVEAVSTGGNVGAVSMTGALARSGTATANLEASAASTGGKVVSKATGLAVALHEGGSAVNSRSKASTSSGMARTSIKIRNTGSGNSSSRRRLQDTAGAAPGGVSMTGAPLPSHMLHTSSHARRRLQAVSENTKLL